MPMANLQVKDVPAELHRRLRSSAKRRGTTIREIVLDAVRRELEHEAFVRRLESRDSVDLGDGAGNLLVAERRAREQEL